MYKVDIQQDIFGFKYLSCIVNGNEYRVDGIGNKWKIYKIVSDYYRTSAKLFDPIFLWEDLPTFPNRSQAFAFLRKNAGKLL